MNYRFLISSPIIKACLYGLPIIAVAQTSLANEVPLNAHKNIPIQSTDTNSDSSWAHWVLSQVTHLPSQQAINEGISVANEQYNASKQALYNPELGASYTHRKEPEYNITWSQTLDLYDKRQMNSNSGQIDSELAQLDKKIQFEDKLSQALLSFIEYSMAQKLLAISKKQEQLLTKLSADLKSREAVGDVGRVDAEMAYLSLSQNLQQISLIEIRYRRAVANLQQSLNSSHIPAYPQGKIWFNTINKDEISALYQQNFKVQYAEKLLASSVSKSKIAQLNKKADPTIGLGVGRDGDENTLLFEVSMPLTIRNNFSSEYRAALHKVNQSEFELQEEQRLLENNMKQSLNNYQQLQERVLSWQKLTAKRLKNSQKLLNRQWKSGDISTSDYLFSLRQRTDTLIANIELEGEMRRAWVEWLLASSQIQIWLKTR